MTLRQYLFALSFGTAVALVGVGIILFMIDPVTASGLTFATLYLTLGASFVGLLTIIGTLWRVHKEASEEVGDAVARSLRQGVVLSAMLLIAMLLSSRNVLTLWTALLLVAVVTLIEFFFMATKKA